MAAKLTFDNVLLSAFLFAAIDDIHCKITVE